MKRLALFVVAGMMGLLLAACSEAPKQEPTKVEVNVEQPKKAETTAEAPKEEEKSAADAQTQE